MEYKGVDYWQGLLDRKTEPMTEEQSRMFMTCVMADITGPDEEKDAKVREAFEDHLGAQVFLRRLEVTGTEVSVPLTLFLLSMCKTPGDAVMWAYTVHAIAVTHGLDKVSTNELAEAFPMGFPTEESIEQAWGSQKKEGEPAGNMVDNWDNWPGIEDKKDEEPEDG
jgi:hypothetical protein